MNIKKIILEVYNTLLNENLGDKYLKRKYGIETEFDDFEKKYKAYKQKEDEVIYRDGDWKLIKNPNSLENIDSDARGVIMPSGDLYIENISGKKIHNDILEILYKKNILIFLPKKNWTRKTPKESGFLTVQRYKSSPYIGIGESNRKIYDKDDYNKFIDDYKYFINKAKQKNPNIKFEYKLVGTKSPIKKSNGVLMDESYLYNIRKKYF